MTTEIEQQSAEWFAVRAGKATASRIADILAKTKSGPAASRTNYAAQLIAERLTGKPAEGFSSAAMQWGNEQEPHARRAYENRQGAFVEQVGFVTHPTMADAGASPDGLVNDDGLIEIKCPNTATHIDTLRSGDIDRKYVLQMQWQMACTGRMWCDFVSFDPRLPESMQLFVKRVPRDNALIAGTQIEVQDFLAEVAATVAELEAAYNYKKAA